MKDLLKDYIENNSDHFEADNDSLDGLWLNISSEIEKKEDKKPKPLFTIWRVAALFILITGLSFYFIQYSINNPNGRISQKKYPLELLEAEGYYTSLIDIKMQQIKSYEDEIDPQIFEDIDALDKALLELKEDLNDNIDNEEVIDAMIQNYRIKLEILETIQSELDKQNSEAIEM